MEQALGIPLIAANILSFISFDEGLLGNRLISKFWNEQVLTEYSKREKIFLNLRKYLELRQRKWHLTADSPLPKRVFVRGGISLRGSLNFFSCHSNVETLELVITERFCGLKESLFKMLQEGLCPNLKHLTIQEFSEEEQFLQQNIDANLALKHLRTLTFSHTGKWESFTVLAQNLLNISPNLEALRIRNTKNLPTFKPNGKLKELKITSSSFNQMVPEFEQLLQQLSPTLEVLKVGTERTVLPKTNFTVPTMPKLRIFSALDLGFSPFFFDGNNSRDLISFLNKKMPKLETLEIGDYCGNRIPGETEKYNRLLSSLIGRLGQENNTLKHLSFPGPIDLQLIQEIKKKFTALNKITITLYITKMSLWSVNSCSEKDAKEIAELAIALANSSGVRDNVIHIYCVEEVIVKQIAMEAIKTKCNQEAFRDYETVFFSKTRKEGGTSVRIKTEGPWCQLDNFGLKSC